MRMSDQIDQIAAALSGAQGQIDAASKAVTNTFFKSKYADLNALRDVIREPLAAHGLSVVQGARYLPETASVCIETMLLHASGQYLAETLDLPVTAKYDRDGTALPVDVQGIGSAISYGRRYSLSALLNLAAEDDDGNAATQKTAPPAPAKPAGASLDLMAEAEMQARRGRDALTKWWAAMPQETRATFTPAQTAALKKIWQPVADGGAAQTGV